MFMNTTEGVDSTTELVWCSLVRNTRSRKTWDEIYAAPPSPMEDSGSVVISKSNFLHRAIVRIKWLLRIGVQGTVYIALEEGWIKIK